MKPLRILHVCHSLEIGGLERVIIDLTKGFRNKGHHVGICCLDGKGALGEDAEKTGITVFSLGKKAGIAWGLPFRVAKIIRQEHFNLVHTHNEAGLLYGCTAAHLSRLTNIVHTEHGKEPEYTEKKFLQIIEKILLKKVKHVVAVSEDLRSLINNFAGIKDNRLSLILNGIDVEGFFRPEHRDKKRESLRIHSGDFVIGNIARFVALKNHQFLFNIFKELIPIFSSLKLFLVGDGPIRRNLEICAIEMGISNYVKFLGEREDIPELLASFDLFVLPSLTEGVSITLLEAMASGTPVVASEVGGNSEIIENEKTGYCIPLDDVTRWIQTIKTLIGDPDKRQNISEMARRVVKEKFSLSRMIEQYENIYYY